MFVGDRVEQIRKSGALKREWWGVGRENFEIPRW
jgi:hypothetical protein